MEYKKIEIDNIETTYRIYKNGKMMNEKTGRYYKGTIRNGYLWFDLRWNNKKYARSQHRLLAEAFLPNPEKLEYVHHKDNNRLNNTLENLEWVSALTNNLAKNKQVSNIIHTLPKSDKNEQWKTFRNTRYMVSNQGRVKNAETNKIMKGKVTAGGYREYCLTFDKKKQSHLAHRLVYETWVSSNMDIINHIDGDKLNNYVENLESVSNRENTIKAIYDTKTSCFKKTAQYDDEGNLVQIFMNNADAARAMGVAPQSIQAAISKNRRSCGYYWKNLEN